MASLLDSKLLTLVVKYTSEKVCMYIIMCYSCINQVLRIMETVVKSDVKDGLI